MTLPSAVQVRSVDPRMARILYACFIVSLAPASSMK